VIICQLEILKAGPFNVDFKLHMEPYFSVRETHEREVGISSGAAKTKGRLGRSGETALTSEKRVYFE
jgi:hypothetical protein